MEADAVDQMLHGVHARQDTLERSVKRVSVATLLNTNGLLKKSLLKKESIFHNFTLMSQKEVSGLTGTISNSDILSDIFLFSLKVNVRKTCVKMAVHVLAKTSVNVHLYIPVLSVQEENWEPKTTRHRTHKQFLTQAIVWAAACTGSSPLVKQPRLKLIAT